MKFQHQRSGIVAFGETIQCWFSLSLGRCYPQQPVCIRSESNNATHFCIRLWLYTFPFFFCILAILYFNFGFGSLIKNSVLGCAIKFWCRYTMAMVLDDVVMLRARNKLNRSKRNEASENEEGNNKPQRLWKGEKNLFVSTLDFVINDCINK